MKKYKIGKYIIDAESPVKAMKIAKVLDSKVKDSFSPNQMVTYKPDGDALMRVKIVKKLTEAEKKAQAGKINPNAGDYYEVEYSSTALGTSRWIVWEGRLKDSVKDSDIDYLTEEEKQAVEDYREAIKKTTNPKLLEVYAHILTEETEHIKELQEAKEIKASDSAIRDEYEYVLDYAKLLHNYAENKDYKRVASLCEALLDRLKRDKLD